MIRGVRRGMLSVVALSILTGLCGCCLIDPPPNPDFVWSPTDPLAFEVVTFTDRSTDTGSPFAAGRIVEWYWDFGDFETSRSQNPRHCYKKSGFYQVQLTVVDSCGNRRTISHEVRVKPSVGGEWRGTIIDLARKTYQLSLQLYHSSSGGITGTAYVDIYACPIIAASLVGDQFTVSFVYPGTGNQWQLVGSFNEDSQRIQGNAFNVFWGGRQFGTFEVRRVGYPSCSSLREEEIE